MVPFVLIYFLFGLEPIRLLGRPPPHIPIHFLGVVCWQQPSPPVGFDLQFRPLIKAFGRGPSGIELAISATQEVHSGGRRVVVEAGFPSLAGRDHLG